MLATRQDMGDAFAGLDSFAEMDSYVDDSGIDDETYLQESGIDTDEVAAAAERKERGSGSSQNRKETVEQALRTLDTPDEESVVAYASERGVSAEYTRKTLQKLVRAGDATENSGQYRLV